MKMFKKLMAVALVAVMALSLFTACGGISEKDFKDKFEEKSGLSEKDYSSTKIYTNIQKELDDIKHKDDKTDIQDAIKSAITKTDSTKNSPTSGVEVTSDSATYAVYWEVSDSKSAKDMANSIYTSSMTSTTYEGYDLITEGKGLFGSKYNVAVVILKKK